MAVHSKRIVLWCLLKCREEWSEGTDWSERLGLFTASIKADAIIKYFDHIMVQLELQGSGRQRDLRVRACSSTLCGFPEVSPSWERRQPKIMGQGLCGCYFADFGENLWSCDPSALERAQGSCSLPCWGRGERNSRAWYLSIKNDGLWGIAKDETSGGGIQQVL